MAAWTEVAYLNTDDVVTNAWVDMVASNLEYLLSPNAGDVLFDNTADYTTTSTSFVDVDATNLKHTITTNEGPVLVTFACSASGSAAESVGFDFDVDGTRVGAAFTFGIARFIAQTNVRIVGFSKLITGLSAGSHTFKLQWRVSGGTGTINSRSAYCGVSFDVIEG